MYIYKDLVTDEACEKSKNKILRKLRMHAGMVDVYLICLANGSDNFDIYDSACLKQKAFPRDTIYLVGLAKGKESALQLSIDLYLSLSQKWDTLLIKQVFEKQKAEFFRRY